MAHENLLRILRSLEGHKITEKSEISLNHPNIKKFCEITGYMWLTGTLFVKGLQTGCLSILLYLRSS